MAENGFNVLLTNDKNLYYQQKVSALEVVIVNINLSTNRHDDIIGKLSSIKTKLTEVELYLTEHKGGYFIL